MNEYNFNEHIKMKLINIFGGSERKETIILDDGNKYLLKLPDPIREKNRVISYINNSVSEYLGCKIIKSIGLPVQDVILGEYTTTASNGKKKTYIACACKNIVPENYFLSEAEKTTLGNDEDSKSAQKPSFQTLDKIVENISDISSTEVKEFYAKQFIVDAFIGNPDRHNGNWGFLTGINGNKIAPIYDCGSSLCPLLTDEELNEYIILNNTSNLLSAIQDSNGNRINYKNYLYACENDEVNNALTSILPCIDINEIHHIIFDTPYISLERKSFYMNLINKRYQQVLLPALYKFHTRNIIIPDINMSPEDLYALYLSKLSKFTQVPINEKQTFYINNKEIIILRATNKYIMLINPDSKKSESLLSIRSNNKESWQTLYLLSKLFDSPINELDIQSETDILYNKKTIKRKGR